MMNGLNREQQLEYILELFTQHTGIALDRSNWSRVRQDIERSMTDLGYDDPADYQRRLEVDKEALDSLVSRLVIGETYFFREQRQFEQIENVVIPDLKSRFGDDHVFRAWCAGCASGEEPFSLGILFDEVGLADQSFILATDISRHSLAKAYRATFGRWSLRGDGAVRAWPYLEKVNGTFRLRRDLVDRINFKYGNLVLDEYPNVPSGVWGFDVILCRNVLIYFDTQTVAQVARRLYDSLAEGGWLITGATDPPLMQYAPFDTVVSEQGVFYRRPTQSTLSRLAVDARALEQKKPHKSAKKRWRVKKEARKAAERKSPPKERNKTRRAYTPRSRRRAASSPPSKPKPATTESRDNGTLDKAKEALAAGDYQTAAELTQMAGESAEAWALRVRALANTDVAIAERTCREATQSHRISPELHHLHGTLLLALGREADAEQALRRVLFLDSSLAVGHLTLGTLLHHRGDLEGARRAFRNAHELASDMDADDLVPLAGGERAGQIAQAAEAELAILSDLTGTRT